MAKEPPTSPNDIKLILSGKFVDATKPLKGERASSRRASLI